jgi:hypothetical protein
MAGWPPANPVPPTAGNKSSLRPLFLKGGWGDLEPIFSVRLTEIQEAVKSENN